MIDFVQESRYRLNHNCICEIASLLSKVTVKLLVLARNFLNMQVSLYNVHNKNFRTFDKSLDLGIKRQASIESCLSLHSQFFYAGNNTALQMKKWEKLYCLVYLGQVNKFHIYSHLTHFITFRPVVI